MTESKNVMAAYAEGLRGTALVRAIIGSVGWGSPSADGGRPVFTGDPDAPWLHVFSDDAALVGFCTLNDLPTELFVSLPGYALFDGIAPALAGIRFDQGAPSSLEYTRADFPMLQSVVDAMKIEAFLHGATQIPTPLVRMREYQRYVLLGRPDGEWMLAPDSQGRRLLAICTTDDTADALTEQVTQQLGVETRKHVVDGRTLFETVESTAGLDGVVFNPTGLVKPRAMGVGLARVVLDA